MEIIPFVEFRSVVADAFPDATIDYEYVRDPIRGTVAYRVRLSSEVKTFEITYYQGLDLEVFLAMALTKWYEERRPFKSNAMSLLKSEAMSPFS